MIDVKSVRRDFPILERLVNGKKLIYLDSAATSQRPRQVIEAMNDYYNNYNANVQRGVHTLSEEATDKYESSREKVAKLINASPQEIVFVRNSTEAINLVAYSLGFGEFKRGDEIVSSVMEHHSNIVPWQFLRERGVRLGFVDINQDGSLKMGDYDKLVNKNTKLVAVTQASNVLGTINPVKEIGKRAHDKGALFLVDGAQSVPHMPVDVKDMDCDFLAYSGHKMLGPTGIGVLYGKEELLKKMRPFLGGGDMIKEVTLEETKYNDIPWKFEAGTPNIAGGIGLGAAADYLMKLGMKNVRDHEKDLTKYALEKIGSVPGIEIYGPKNVEIRGGVVSFNLKGAHPHDVASIIDGEGIAIRSGHACAQPLMKRLGVVAVSRASFYIYNIKEEIDYLEKAFEKVRKVLRI